MTQKYFYHAFVNAIKPTITSSTCLKEHIRVNTDYIPYFQVEPVKVLFLRIRKKPLHNFFKGNQSSEPAIDSTCFDLSLNQTPENIHNQLGKQLKAMS